MAASRQSDVDMFGYWEAHRKSGSHSTYWWRDMLRALRPPVPRRDSILQDLLRACPSVKEKGSSAKEQEPEFVASVRASLNKGVNPSPQLALCPLADPAAIDVERQLGPALDENDAGIDRAQADHPRKWAVLDQIVDDPAL